MEAVVRASQRRKAARMDARASIRARPSSGLRRGRGVGRSGRCGDRALDPPASMFFGAHLIHRTCDGHAFHAAASVRTCASRRAPLMPVAVAVVIAIRVTDAGHHSRFALFGREFALSFDDARQCRIQEPLRSGSSRGELHLGGDNLPRRRGSRGSVNARGMIRVESRGHASPCVSGKCRAALPVS
jgi:hypothetical protein